MDAFASIRGSRGRYNYRRHVLELRCWGYEVEENLLGELAPMRRLGDQHHAGGCWCRRWQMMGVVSVVAKRGGDRRLQW